ncbi:CaiB/BaiF CoA transferase family protein [Microvirga calopogonii]|uniref:CaiB/BaiF CoA transferase family protein n=1 Tax=Microvirga calopogonii TaxID=2078013 RepID=UPI000E0D8391|nr:CoA transferase [Microvirga calopogonii]
MSRETILPEAVIPDARPLKGLTVVEICHSVAGPYAGAVLAELGADVIKVEDPRHGDHARGWGPPYWHGTSCAFQSLNRDKRGITVDLGDPAQAADLKDFILRKADAVIQNLRPGSIDKTGLSGATLLSEKPSLIYCNLGAFGATGPLAHRPGYDPLMQAFGGLMSVTGEEGGSPVRVGPAIVDMGSAMWAVIGILAALQQRNATGRGCVVDTSLFETAVAWMTIQVAGHLATGEIRRPMGSGIPEIVPHQAFRAMDGFIMVAAGNDGLFRALCHALGRPDWADDPRFATNDARVRNRKALIPLLEAVFLTANREHWAECLDRSGVPNAPIQSLDQVVVHEQTRALGLIQAAPDRDMALVGLPLSFDGVRPPYRCSAPELGEHNLDLRAEGPPIQRAKISA